MTDDSHPRRKTRQRETIESVIREADGPLTVTEILDAARTEIPRLGQATVYRTLSLLADDGAVQPVMLPDGLPRYEPSDRGHHHHFRCRECERVFDLEGCMLRIGDNATLPGGFVVEDHEITLIGRCPACVEVAEGDA